MMGVSERKTAATAGCRSPLLPTSTTTTTTTSSLSSNSSSSSSSSSRPSFGTVLLLAIAVVTALSAYELLTAIFDGSHRRHSPAVGVVDPVVEMPHGGKREEGSGASGAPFHVAVTANDSPYSKWQIRIMYYWYSRVRSMPGGGGHHVMGSFTRILHSGAPDDLVHEIPTFVVDPLPPGTHRGYVVLNRPWAFVQWLRKAKIKEDYILMAEPDHIFVKPLPNLARGMIPAAFPFFYITPQEHEKIIRKYYPEEKGPLTDIDPIGNSPVMIHKSQLEQIAPTWMNVSIRMKEDSETDKTFGWVLEMYGYAVASALHGVQHILPTL